MTTLAPPPPVTSYANAVRDHLAGLDAETLDELTGGLEADLAEALSERMPDGGATDLAAVTSLFGSPGLYADELRSAAGIELPAAGSVRPRPGMRDAVRRARIDARATWDALLARHGLLRGAIAFLVALRPVWWVARSWMIFWMIVQPGYAQPLGHGLFQHLMLLAAVVVSVMWGQGRFGQQRWLRRVGLLASVVAAFALPIVLNLVGHQLGNASEHGGSSTQSYWDGYNTGLAEASAGASGAGLTASNLFVYGPDGLPIENAQIVDQSGNPVVLTDPESRTSWAAWDGWSWMGEAVPVPALEGSALNVYPWSYVDADDVSQGPDGMFVGSADDAQDPQWPAATLFPVITEDAPKEGGSQESAATDDPASNATDEESHPVGTESPEAEPPATEGASDAAGGAETSATTEGSSETPGADRPEDADE